MGSEAERQSPVSPASATFWPEQPRKWGRQEELPPEPPPRSRRSSHASNSSPTAPAMATPELPPELPAVTSEALEAVAPQALSTHSSGPCASASQWLMQTEASEARASPAQPAAQPYLYQPKLPVSGADYYTVNQVTPPASSSARPYGPPPSRAPNAPRQSRYPAAQAYDEAPSSPSSRPSSVNSGASGAPAGADVANSAANLNRVRERPRTLALAETAQQESSVPRTLTALQRAQRLRLSSGSPALEHPPDIALPVMSFRPSQGPGSSGVPPMEPSPQATAMQWLFDQKDPDDALQT